MRSSKAMNEIKGDNLCGEREVENRQVYNYFNVHHARDDWSDLNLEYRLQSSPSYAQDQHDRLLAALCDTILSQKSILRECCIKVVFRNRYGWPGVEQQALARPRKAFKNAWRNATVAVR